MGSSDAAKIAAARDAVSFVQPGAVLGVGSGSTVAHFIRELGESGVRPSHAVSTSDETDRLLSEIGVAVTALEQVDGPIEVYVDGADEIDRLGRAIKGGGGAHTREKRVAKASSTWVCIVDDSKVVSGLGEGMGVPVEVEKDHVREVTKTVADWGAVLHVRPDWNSDPRHVLLDVAGLDMSDPDAMESQLELLPGVVTCGIFAHRRADLIVIGRTDGSVLRFVPDKS